MPVTGCGTLALLSRATSATALTRGSTGNKNTGNVHCDHYDYQRCQIDPEGEYIRKYLPQLSRMPVEFIYEPWKAPESVQREAGCLIGVDYPRPIVNHEEVSRRNRGMMEELRMMLSRKCNLEPDHLKPSDADEIDAFFGLSNNQ